MPVGRRRSLGLLHIKRFGRDEGDKKSKYSHSKVMLATSGSMISITIPTHLDTDMPNTVYFLVQSMILLVFWRN
jgi:hypothetical protein